MQNGATNMIYTTEAPNDDDLHEALGSIAVRAPVPHGDAVFFGVNSDSSPIRIACERKKVSDMVASVLDGRYLSQAQAASDAGFDQLVLIVEGEIRVAKDGSIRTRPDIQYSRFDRYMTDLSLLGGILVKRSAHVQETAAIVKATWLWFQRPDHQSLNVIYNQPHPHVTLTKPSLVRRIAKELPGIGWGRSAAVDSFFPSVVSLVMATENDWKSIDGIGPKTAKQVVAALSSLRGK